jgi:hypothetical protein
MMISDNFGEFLLANLRDIFTKHTEKSPDFKKAFFNVNTSTKAQEFNHGFGALGKMKKWDESGAQVYYDTIRAGYKATYTMEKLSIGLPLEREWIDDRQYDQIKTETEELADSVYYTIQEDYVAKPFNECESYIGPDSVALASTAHPLGPSNSSTQSNKGSYALTPANVEIVRNLMKGWVDDRGKKIMINPNMLIVPKEYRKAAKIIADTDNEPFTTDYGVNVWKGSLDVVEFDFLDAGVWFMVDKNRMKRYLKWYDRRKPTIEKDGKEDFDSEVIKYKAVGRWAMGYDDWSWIYCNIV